MVRKSLRKVSRRKFSRRKMKRKTMKRKTMKHKTMKRKTMRRNKGGGLFGSKKKNKSSAEAEVDLSAPDVLELMEKYHGTPFAADWKAQVEAARIADEKKQLETMWGEVLGDEGVEGLHVDVVGCREGGGPRLLKFLHQVGFEILGLVPELVKPLAETLVVLITVHHDVQLAVMAESGEGQIRRADHGDAVLVLLSP